MPSPMAWPSIFTTGITVWVAEVTASAGDSESVMVMEKVKVPLAEGVPATSPLARVKPGGSNPLVTA